MHPVPKPVKQTKISKVDNWNSIRKELKQEFEDMGVTTCELKLPDCFKNNFLSFAHTVKRRDVEDLKRVALACQNCHHKVEYECEKWTGLSMEDYLESIISYRMLTRHTRIKSVL